MRKISEYTNVTYHYSSKEERDDHVKLMESEGWECSGQVKERFSIYQDSVWCGKFTKYN
ncbi:hypothetical protein JCM16418A_14430 [Paenibacillus pini]|uniref:DUF2812 domain-containing protein n=1 Tax=Paenibacillus pini JCM 16418 TaxID=1236976 RepID=W7YIW3_9BACL|nr:hypothetical protein JCM16418_5065 [Paenibacillus pini JCM 16418]